MWEGYEWGEGRPDKILLSQVRTGTRGQLSFLRPPRCMGLLRIFMRMGMKGSILAA